MTDQPMRWDTRPETCPACKSEIERTLVYGVTTYCAFECGASVKQEPGKLWEVAFPSDCDNAFDTAVRLQAEHVAAFERALSLRNERDAAIQRGDNCSTEHSRALLRVGVLEGLLEQLRQTVGGVASWALGRAFAEGDKHWIQRAHQACALLADTDAALAQEVG